MAEAKADDLDLDAVRSQVCGLFGLRNLIGN
jgi:hypothetical protein